MQHDVEIEYSVTRAIGREQFVDLLRRSTLGERRPIDDGHVVDQMLAHANLLCTAWAGPLLVGVARSVTDFGYCCYLSDLAVDEAWQHRGIGKRLCDETQARLGPKCKLILLAAPKAAAYYPKIGFAQHPSAWVRGR